jgi:glucose-1-phosphate thymidylyltransferase
MKGVILAGGSGTRLHPLTKVMSKQLLPVYDKPMIYYPLSVLMLAGIKDILIITTPYDLLHFKSLLNDGKSLGIKLNYEVQQEPKGLAQAFIIGKEFIGDDSVCLILGDNIFHGHSLSYILENAIKNVKENNKSTVFGYYVNDPSRYGVVDFDENGNAKSIEEKPEHPKSNYAVVGLYFYTNDVVKIASTVAPSTRGELEITSVNQKFLQLNKLKVEIMGRGFAWIDTGTCDTLLEAGQFIQTIEKRQGLKVACLEEISFIMNFINKDQLKKLANAYNNNYKTYLLNLLN